MTDVATSTPLIFSARAIQEIKHILANDDIDPAHYLRIGVKGGGCHGMSYVMAFDEKGEHDTAFEVDGIKMVMDKRHGLYLLGMEVDFEDGLNARGFSFKNPNAKSSCGCGSSFQA